MVFIGLVWFCFFVMIKSSLFLVLFMYTLFFFYYLNVPIDDHDVHKILGIFSCVRGVGRVFENIIDNC